MGTTSSGRGAMEVLTGEAYALLARRVDAAREKAAARSRPVLAGVTIPCDPVLDPLLMVARARLDGEPWTVFEQPDSGEWSLATLGSCAEVMSAYGSDRFDVVVARTARILAAAEHADLSEDADAPRGAGPVWVGGFSFYDDSSWGDAWRGLPAADFRLPAISVARQGGERPQARVTVNMMVDAGDETGELLAGAEAEVDRLFSEARAPEAAYGPAGAAMVSGSAPPEHYEHAVSQATRMIRDGKIEKVVLAREIVVRRDRPISPFRAVDQLRREFPECTTFAIGRDDVTFLGASPELLIRREGRRASTMALAGSTRRGSDAATDDHLGRQLLASEKDKREHAIVTKRIEHTLGRHSAWVATGRTPVLVKVKNIQHLATPIRAQLTEPRPVLELAGMLHPTPAVGGEPWPEASEAIKSLEGFDRGWYAGGVGWMDQLEDGEFHVALRSALVEGSQARLFVGAGIVADSDPASELAETETKLEALLPVLSSC